MLALEGIHKNVSLLYVNSLYPSALAELQIPIDEPKVLTANIKLENVKYYMFEIDIVEIGTPRSFYPLLKLGSITVDKYELVGIDKY
jgi:hypothetical protein